MEFKQKNRDWVKNAALVFLSVLLVLTFFSNTWMNRSLPEVATQYVTNGSITAKVRGSGTVSAVGTHTVKAEETREIRAVMVKTGQRVEAGDVLFVLGQGEASELEAAQEKLRQLQISYQRSAINVPTANYSLEEKRIADAAAAVEEARAKVAQLESQGAPTTVTSQLQAAENEVAAATASLQVAKDDLAARKVDYETAKQAYDNKLAETQGYWTSIKESDSAAATSAQDAYNEAEAKVLTYTESRDLALYTFTMVDADYSALKLKFDEQTWNEDAESRAEDVQQEPTDRVTQEMLDQAWAAREAASAALAQAESDLAAAQAEAEILAEAAQTAQAQTENDIKEEQDAIAAVSDAEVKTTEAKVAEAEQLVTDAEEVLRIATEKRDAIQATIQELADQNGVSDELVAARAAYKSAQDTLYELQYSLQEKKESDYKSQQLSYLDLADIGQQIELAKEKVNELSGGEENQILAKVAGTILTVDCAPGDTKLKGDVLCTIEVPDMGYSMSFSVTNDQARRLKPGDTATVSNYYWGNQIVATLESIKTDPKNPQTNKLLNFSLTGDVTAGTELTISVGQKSANYDIIVPNSAIRSDTNGSFVLSIESKNSPLGNRYIARRVDVTVLAEDDVNSAVTADLSYGDYVITTSNAPVKNGDMVRLADNA